MIISIGIEIPEIIQMANHKGLFVRLHQPNGR